MKTILVTVKEFLENGGELKNGRWTYMENGIKYQEYDGVKTSYIKTDIADKVYIQIEATPHYK